MTDPAGPNSPGTDPTELASARARDWVAIILSLGIALAINLITAGVLYDAIVSTSPGLSENATQVITLAFGGIIGILGSYVGYKTGQGKAPPA